ncbi:Microsomal signal peptidase subunit 3 [Golovinomyces cichoracearum]|uniref:Signal peptidase subunit 3 n=1 Tax=Golovinomyces cichoracearum TaxID=62708 RepID=A0A420HH91_9PEZI|nr:Microsomal signal peptidase subunit 3 [Golovinomyces cichoracearum]
MHSTTLRLQNVFGFFTTVIFAVAILIASSDLFVHRTPSASISLKEAQVIYGRPHYYSVKKEQYAVIRFSLSTDLSSLFNWNTKQLFVYVTASWPNSTSTEISNEAVIWDTIITNPSADHLLNVGPATLKKLVASSKGRSIDPRRGKLNLKNQKAKYQITSPTGKVAEIDNMVLKLNYNVQPWVGALTWTPQLELWRWKNLDGGVSAPFKLPAMKAKGNAKV